MLSQTERQEIEAELEHFPHRQNGCIDALKIVQRQREWVSDEAIKDIAEFLHTSPEAIDSVATFYNLIFRQPVGRHVIRVCDSVSCWIMGYERIRAHLAARLNIDFGQTTTDNQFTLLPIQCLGTCDHAPAIMIDEHVHQDLSLEKMDEILSRYQQGRDTGTVIVLDDQTCPVGMVRNLEHFFAQESCGWCTPCREGLPWVEKILDAIESGQGQLHDLDRLALQAKLLGPGNTFCAFAPGAVEPLQSALKYFRADFERHIEERTCPYTL